MDGFPEADLNSSIDLSSFRSDYYENRISPTKYKKQYKGSIYKNMEDPRDFEFIQIPPPPQFKLNRQPKVETGATYKVKNYGVENGGEFQKSM
jgi:hypothetical protein